MQQSLVRCPLSSLFLTLGGGGAVYRFPSLPGNTDDVAGNTSERLRKQLLLLSPFSPWCITHPSVPPSVRPLSSIQFPSFLTESLNNNPPLSPSLALKLLHTRSRAPFHLRPRPGCRSGLGRRAIRCARRGRRTGACARWPSSSSLVGFRGVLFRWSMSMWTESDWVRSLPLPPSLMRARLTLDVVFFTVLVLLSFPPPSMEGLAWLLRYLMPTPPMFFARYPFPPFVLPLWR